MFLSVIVPMYNSEKFAGQLFEVINNSVTNDIEFILIDDGSTDDTYNICRYESRNRNNIKIIHNSNLGVSYSRNYGISEATGEYIMFLDSDDKLIEGWIKTIINAVKKSNSADIIVFSSRANIHNPDLRQVIRALIGLPSNLRCDYLGAPWSKVYRRKLLYDNEILFNEAILHGEDALFNMNAFFHASNYYFDTNSIYLYQINYLSATHKYDKRFLFSNEQYLLNLENILIASGQFDKNEIASFIDYSFANSVYIFVGKTSKLNKQSERMIAVKDFYKDEYCNQKLVSTKVPPQLGLSKKIIYLLVKWKMLTVIETVLPELRKKHTHRESYWITV